MPAYICYVLIQGCRFRDPTRRDCHVTLQRGSPSRRRLAAIVVAPVHLRAATGSLSPRFGDYTGRLGHDMRGRGRVQGARTVLL